MIRRKTWDSNNGDSSRDRIPLLSHATRYIRQVALASAATGQGPPSAVLDVTCTDPATSRSAIPRVCGMGNSKIRASS